MQQYYDIWIFSPLTNSEFICHQCITSSDCVNLAAYRLGLWLRVSRAFHGFRAALMVLLALEIPAVLQDQVVQVSQQRLDYQLVRGRREVRLARVRRRLLVDLADLLDLAILDRPVHLDFLNTTNCSRLYQILV